MKWILGIGLWLALVVAGFLLEKWLPEHAYDDARRTYDDIASMVEHGPTEVRIYFPERLHLAPRDGLYIRVEGQLKRIGELTATWVDNETGGVRVRALIDPHYLSHIQNHTEARAVIGAGSIPWIIQTLLPERTMNRIRNEWDNFQSYHLDRLIRDLTPVAIEAAREFPRVLLSELERSLESRESEWKGLLEAYREEVLKESFVPLIESEVWPLVLAHAKPHAETIGREIWAEVPLWGFAWRGVYDKMFFTDPVHLEERWKSFLGEKIIPIVESHTDDFEAMVEQLLRAIVDNDALQNAVGESLLKLRDDPRVHRLVQGVLEDVLLKSSTPKLYFLSKLRDRRVRFAFSRIESDFDSFRIRVGNSILLAEDRSGISPEFSRFLRTLVMKKDQRWIYLSTKNESLDAAPYSSETWLRGLPPVTTLQ